MDAHRGFWTVSLAALLLFGFALPMPATAQDEGNENTTGICREISPNDAIARGHGAALIIRETITNQDLEFGPAESERIGPGEDQGDHNGIVVEFPPDDSPLLGPRGSIAKVGIVETTTTSKVDAETLRADQHTISEVVNISLLDGDITAHTARASAHTTTDQGMADMTGESSALQDVNVNGVAYHNVVPNLKVPLPAEVFGEGSYVRLYERNDQGFFPGGSKPWYRANMTSRMIHVKITDYVPATAANETLEIIVAEAAAYSQTPTPFCGGIQGVHASAYGARVRSSPFFWAPSVRVGYVKIPQTGGTSDQTWTDVDLPVGQQNLLHMRTINSQADGKVVLDEKSSANGVAKIEQLCIKKNSDEREGDCIIWADAIRAESHARAFMPGIIEPGEVNNGTVDPDGRIWWGKVVIANLTIGDTSVCLHIQNSTIGSERDIQTCEPPKNFNTTLPGGFKLYMNERQRDLTPDGHVGYWVRAVRIEHPMFGEKDGQVGSITLGRAYSEADFR